MHLIYPQILVYPQISPDLWIYSDQQKCSRTVIVFVKKTNILFFFTSFAQVIYRYLAPFKVPIASKKFFYHQEFSTRFCAERRSILAFLFADFVVIEPRCPIRTKNRLRKRSEGENFFETKSESEAKRTPWTKKRCEAKRHRFAFAFFRNKAKKANLFQIRFFRFFCVLFAFFQNLFLKNKYE